MAHVRFGSVAALPADSSSTAAFGRIADVIRQGFWQPDGERLLSPGADVQHGRKTLTSGAAIGQKWPFNRTESFCSLEQKFAALWYGVYLTVTVSVSVGDSS